MGDLPKFVHEHGPTNHTHYLYSTQLARYIFTCVTPKLMLPILKTINEHHTST